MGFMKNLTGSNVRKSKKTLKEIEENIVRHKKEIAQGQDSALFKIKAEELRRIEEKKNLSSAKIEALKARASAALPVVAATHVYNR